MTKGWPGSILSAVGMGLTWAVGWALVGVGIGIATGRRKFRYDVFYVRNRSLAMDLDLIVRSIRNSLVGAWPGSENSTD